MPVAPFRHKDIKAMKNWIIGSVVVAMVAATFPSLSEAKRLGGSKSSGMQRDMPARTAPDAPPAKPATPAPANTPAQPGAAAPAAAGAAAAATAKRSWMGPIAGLAAGLGLVALASAFGFGEELANFLMLALLAIAAIALVAFLMRRFGANKAQPAMAGGNGMAKSGAQVSWPTPSSTGSSSGSSTGPMARVQAGSGVTDPVPGLAGSVAAEPVAAEAAPVRSVPKAFVPAAFDSENFARTAKMIFIRLQAANDAADLEDLRRFTTPELFASLRLDIQERGASENHTDVQRIDAEVLDVTDEAERQVVSVRFRGDIVEERGGQPQAFDEVWHLVKPHGDAGSAGQWAIAGIEQMN
jgi:predicted lipid-binding transport protein (Tim44 family)